MYASISITDTFISIIISDTFIYQHSLSLCTLDHGGRTYLNEWNQRPHAQRLSALFGLCHGKIFR